MAPPFVVSRRGALHAELDRVALARAFASEPVPAEPRERIVGPHDVHVIERIRERDGVRAADGVPADWFVWGTGEGSHRAMTKLGGVPYLPASTPWPERDGTVGDFYAQLVFADSRDLVPELPRDVLLVFRFHDLAHTSWDEALYEFVWVPLRDQDLIRPGQVRRSRAAAADAEPWPVMHGYRVRTFDLPSPPDRTRSLGPRPAGWSRVHATKIGGVASDVQSAWSPEVPADWRFLGEIAAVIPAVGVPFPVVDRAAPIARYPAPEHRAVTSGPGDGVTCLWLDGAGRVRVRFSCG